MSEPFLGDPNFERSVVLLCEHSEEGAFGFVLNRPTPVVINEAHPQITNQDFEIYIGGPVEQNTLHYVHRLGNKLDDALQLNDDLYWSGDFETLISLLNAGLVKLGQVRFFVGYSGWGPGQLEEEIADDSWVVNQNPSINPLEESADQLWRTVLRSMGGKYKALANYPTDPRLN